jgi:hypothetical protein
MIEFPFSAGDIDSVPASSVLRYRGEERVSADWRDRFGDSFRRLGGVLVENELPTWI